tara:strand:+ start:8594 stop:9493 length:900 start_codon:yes stop_codon:yes gene_type:complete
MAVPTNTRTTYGAVGIREDLSNIIYNIAPEETPFMSGIGRSTADNTYFEWQTDTLNGGNANRAVEGDDASVIAVDEPERVGNYTQISTKAVQSSGTSEAVDFAGRKSTQAYQMAKRAKELKLDMEKMLLEASTSPSAGTSSSARATGSVGAWITSNAVVGTAVSEDDIRECMEKCWEAGAKPEVIMVDGVIKQAISALSQSVSQLQTTANNKSPAYVVAAVDIYISDFGNLQIVPNRLMPAETAYLLDYEYWDIAYLRPFMTHDLARTGDSISQLLVVEYGLRAKNEAANGKITGWAAP